MYAHLQNTHPTNSYSSSTLKMDAASSNVTSVRNYRSVCLKMSEDSNLENVNAVAGEVLASLSCEVKCKTRSAACGATMAISINTSFR